MPDGQMPAPAQPTSNLEPKTGQLYKGRAPIELQLIGGLMYLSAAALTLSGIFDLVLLDLTGLITIAIGFALAKFAKGLFKLEKKSFWAALALYGLVALASLVVYFMNDMTSSSRLFSALMALLFCAVLYLRREKFVY